MDIIEVKNLTQDFGHGRGVFDVSFNVKKGEVFGFLGPNGAGKSTTIRHIMGFCKPQSGSTNVFGLESFKNYYNILKNVGYLPGEIALPEGLTGSEFIEMMAELRGVQNEDMLKYLLEKFDLNPTPETKLMSLGDKRKLAIVTAFMADPDVLILDEPTSGLDPVMQENFIEFIKEEKIKGKTILLSSHMFNEVQETCDRIAIIKDGKIVTIFEANDIKHNSNKSFSIYFDDKASYDSFLKAYPLYSKNKKATILEILEKKDDILCVEIAINDKDINKLIASIKGLKIKKIEEIKFTLEDYFMQFYKEDKNFGGALWKKKK